MIEECSKLLLSVDLLLLSVYWLPVSSKHEVSRTVSSRVSQPTRQLPPQSVRLISIDQCVQ